MIINKETLESIFESLSNKEQNTIITFLLDKCSTKLVVFDFQANKILTTSSFKEAFDKAFMQNNRGYISTNTNLTFFKQSPSLITNSITDLLFKIMDYRGYSPNSLHSELRKNKLISFDIKPTITPPISSSAR